MSIESTQASEAMVRTLLSERLFEAAIGLFRTKGYQSVSMLEVAEVVSCPLDDLYRYFPQKEYFIQKLYERITSDVESAVLDLPLGTIAERFAALMELKLRLIEPNVSLFRSLMSAAIDPANPLAVLGPASDRIRARVQKNRKGHSMFSGG